MHTLEPTKYHLLFPDQFGCLAWSHSETHLLYVAEKKRPKTESFFKPRAPELNTEEELAKTERDKAVKVGWTFPWMISQQASLSVFLDLEKLSPCPFNNLDRK